MQARQSPNQFAYRLSNTAKPIGELMNDDKAILLENALIDLRNPLNFPFQKICRRRAIRALTSCKRTGRLTMRSARCWRRRARRLFPTFRTMPISCAPPASVANGIAADGIFSDSLRAVLQSPVVAACIRSKTVARRHGIEIWDCSTMMRRQRFNKFQNLAGRFWHRTVRRSAP